MHGAKARKNIDIFPDQPGAGERRNALNMQSQGKMAEIDTQWSVWRQAAMRGRGSESGTHGNCTCCWIMGAFSCNEDWL